MLNISEFEKLVEAGPQEPFMLYSKEVLDNLLSDLKPLEQPLKREQLEVITNQGKIYYGDTYQMCSRLQTMVDEKKIQDEIVEWLVQWTDLIVRSQYTQKWCSDQIVGILNKNYKEKEDLYPSFDSLVAMAFYKKMKCNEDFCRQFDNDFNSVLEDALNGYKKIKLNLMNVVKERNEKLQKDLEEQNKSNNVQDSTVKNDNVKQVVQVPLETINEEQNTSDDVKNENVEVNKSDKDVTQIMEVPLQVTNSDKKNETQQD